jgi:hypothetical protein
MEAFTDPRGLLQRMRLAPEDPQWRTRFEQLVDEEKASIKDYLQANRKGLSEKFSLTMTPARIDIVASYYVKHVLDTGSAVRHIKSCYDEIKNAELYFFKNHDINMVLEEDAIDFLMEMIVESAFELRDVYPRLSAHFEHGLRLVREKTGRSRFFISRSSLLNPEQYIHAMITGTPLQG